MASSSVSRIARRVALAVFTTVVAGPVAHAAPITVGFASNAGLNMVCLGEPSVTCSSIGCCYHSALGLGRCQRQRRPGGSRGRLDQLRQHWRQRRRGAERRRRPDPGQGNGALRGDLPDQHQRFAVQPLGAGGRYGGRVPARWWRSHTFFSALQNQIDPVRARLQLHPGGLHGSSRHGACRQLRAADGRRLHAADLRLPDQLRRVRRPVRRQLPDSRLARMRVRPCRSRPR